MYVIYEARRGLVPYHTLGVSYSVDFDTTDVVPPNGDDLKTQQESISGKIETCYYGERRVWSLTTIPLQQRSAAALILLEFLRSTADGQGFILDPYGYVDRSVSPLTVIRADNGYKCAKFQDIDGVNDYFKYSFQVREI